MKAIWLGADAALIGTVLLGLQSRWPDARLSRGQSVEQLVERGELGATDIVFLRLDGANADQTLGDIRAIHETSDAPLLVLAAAAAGPMERVKALYLGADAVIPADCGPLEIQATTVALLRRKGGPLPQRGEALQAGDILISPAEQTVHLAGKRIRLTPTEFRLLFALAQRRGYIVTHDMLARAVWGASGADNLGVLRKYVQRLRAKLTDSAKRPRRIANIPGVGYRLVAPQDAATRRVS